MHPRCHPSIVLVLIKASTLSTRIVPKRLETHVLPCYLLQDQASSQVYAVHSSRKVHVGIACRQITRTLSAFSLSPFPQPLNLSLHPGKLTAMSREMPLTFQHPFPTQNCPISTSWLLPQPLEFPYLGKLSCLLESRLRLSKCFGSECFSSSD